MSAVLNKIAIAVGSSCILGAIGTGTGLQTMRYLRTAQVSSSEERKYEEETAKCRTLEELENRKG
jgi:hypothetical protein